MTKIREIANKIALPLILLMGLGLRTIGLGRKPLWFDEACSVAGAQKPFSYFFAAPHMLDYKPTYFLFLKLWIKLFGMAEFQLRLFSVIFSVLSIYLIYRLAKMLYDHNVAVLSAFLLSISAFHIFHAQQTRYQSLMVAFVITSYLLFIKFCLKPDTKYLLLNAVLNFLIISIHPYGIFLVITQYVSICIYNRMLGKGFLFRWVGLQAAGIILYVLLFFVPSASSISERTWWIQKVNFYSLRELFFTLMFGGPRYGLDDYSLPARLLIIPTIFSVIFFCICLSSALHSFENTPKGNRSRGTFNYTVLLCWLVLPALIAYAISYYFKPVFLIKNLIYLLPPFLILSAKGLESVGRRILKTILLAALFLTALSSLPLIYKNDDNIQWRQAVEYLRNNIKTGDSVVVSTCKEIIPFLYYFDYANKDKLKDIDIYGRWYQDRWEQTFKCNGSVLVCIRDMGAEGLASDNPYMDFHAKSNENKFLWTENDIWLAVSRWGEVGNYPLIEIELSKTHKITSDNRFHGVRLSYWEKIK